MAAKAATTALVVATRAAVDRCGAGNGVPPLVPEGGHHERRPTGQTTGTSTRLGPARPGGMRPKSLFELRPQEKVEQHGRIGYQLVQALDDPVLQIVEEADDYDFLHGLLDLQEQMIVQELPVPSSM